MVPGLGFKWVLVATQGFDGRHLQHGYLNSYTRGMGLVRCRQRLGQRNGHSMVRPCQAKGLGCPGWRIDSKVHQSPSMSFLSRMAFPVNWQHELCCESLQGCDTDCAVQIRGSAVFPLMAARLIVYRQSESSTKAA